MVEICSPTFFGFAFADEKHEEMDRSNVLSNVHLGVLTDFSTLLSHGSIIVGITQKRRKKLRDLVDTALAASQLVSRARCHHTEHYRQGQARPFGRFQQHRQGLSPALAAARSTTRTPWSRPKTE